MEGAVGGCPRREPERALAELVNRAEARVREAAENRKNRSEASGKIRQLRSNLEAARDEQRRNALARRMADVMG